MSRQCPACSRTNPDDADYCHYDGRPLSKERQAGPLHVGTLPFPTPFHFADGQVCANFNQLALACDERWDEAKALLGAGYWPTFFGTIGRLDLAAAAKQAAAEPDADLGLSLLLEKLPADPDALRPPKLAIEPAEKYLGLLMPGTSSTFELMIINQGMLVLRGMVLSNSDWLAVGERGGPAQKMFQTRNFCNVPVRVLGHKLRSGHKALQGEIVVDTNGGALTLKVRADVPVIPFPRGVYGSDALAGARSPHEIAVKAKQFPHEAAILFEQLAVKAWYESNGWTYPVEGSAGSGKGAVQQFFEALGLTRPPLLQIDTAFLMFKGRVGELVSRRVTLSTEEAKPVYAQAWSNREWVRFGPIKYLGNKVKIPVEIVTPPQPGATLQAEVIVQGNGKQRFVVPVTLTVEGASAPIVQAPVHVAADAEPQGLPARIKAIIKNLFG